MKKHDKHVRKSLSLQVETVRRLDALALARVAGGIPVSTTPLCVVRTQSGCY